MTRAALGTSLCLLLTGACFDTRIIPAGDISAAGGGLGASGGSSGSTPDGGSGEAGAPASGGSPSVTWLALVNDTAPGSDPPNGTLGIDGAVYGYADGCATWAWDPTTRCMSGYLCNAGASFQNWGVAVGFDFRNTGPSGNPPNTKLLWNPDDVGVRGIAWQISGVAPGLQVWVLNMDPSWGGACSAMTCEINGPPDGAPTPSLDGELLFSDMKKDYWGGTGVTYTFDPAKVHALQFKLPAINVPGASFDFCIDALGVIR
ncbi:MAG TPA: hypothetical protein VGI10_06425 [Polyangiaceae bacterium]